MGQEGLKQIRIQKEKVVNRKREEKEGSPPPPDTKKVQQKGKEIKDKIDKVVEEIDEVLKEAEETQAELKKKIRGEKNKTTIPFNPRIPLCDGTMVDPRKLR